MGDLKIFVCIRSVLVIRIRHELCEHQRGVRRCFRRRSRLQPRRTDRGRKSSGCDSCSQDRGKTSAVQFFSFHLSFSLFKNNIGLRPVLAYLAAPSP